jgi:hypothetical protein
MAPLGEQAKCTRHSVVYFARPEDDVVLRRLDGKRIPKAREGNGSEGGEGGVRSAEWIRRKALGMRRS